VDEVIIGAPFVVDKGLLESQNISVVFSGTEYDVPHGSVDPYKIAKEVGLYKPLQSPSKVTTTYIIDRILANRAAFHERNRRKEEKERLAVESQLQ
jgi:glycerol-3-phosphate cytidylyltransferase-like family protein